MRKTDCLVRITVLLLCVLVGPVDLLAQTRLRLERIDAPQKHRLFKMRYYQITTLDSVFFQQVVGYNDSLLFLQREVNVGDSLVTVRGDWITPDRTMRVPRYLNMSSQLPIDQISCLMMGRNGRSTLHEPFGYIGWCGTLAVILTAPFVIASNDKESLDTWATGAAASGGFVAASLILERSVRRGEERKRWRLVPRR